MNWHYRFFVYIALAALCLNSTGRVAAEHPNIVVVLCDDLGYGDIECYGHPHIKTPNINNKLAVGR